MLEFKKLIWIISAFATLAHAILIFSVIFSLSFDKPLIGLPFIALPATMALVILFKKTTNHEMALPTFLKLIIVGTITCVVGANMIIMLLKVKGNSPQLMWAGGVICVMDLALFLSYQIFCQRLFNILRISNLSRICIIAKGVADPSSQLNTVQ